MKCSEFKEWLNDKDLFDENAAVFAIKHVESCEPCKRLYALDLQIEAQIRAGFKQVDFPQRLWARIEKNLESPDAEQSINILSRKKLVPAIAVAAILWLLLNPFSGKIKSLEEVGNLSVNNHLDKMATAIKVGKTEDMLSWFEKKVGCKVVIPHSIRQNVQFAGGKKCHLSKNDVAYFLCEEKGKIISLFVIDPDDVNCNIKDKEPYYMSVRGCTVKIWKEANLLYAMVE